MQRRLVLCLALLAWGAGGLWGVARAQPDPFEAATNGDREALLAALDAGADIDARDAYGQTPLMYAISTGQPTAFVRLLVEQGADVNARTEAGWTPMMYAARDLQGAHFAEVVLLLYGAGADPTATNAEGRTARHYRRAAAAAPPPPEPPPAPSQSLPEPPEPTADPFEALAGFLAREAGFTPGCGMSDAFYEKQWCGYRATPMPFETFLGHWEAALDHAARDHARPEPRRAWRYDRGVHVAFYDADGDALAVSFDPNAGLVLLTLR